VNNQLVFLAAHDMPEGVSHPPTGGDTTHSSTPDLELKGMRRRLACCIVLTGHRHESEYFRDESCSGP
jgi:hypothetical protein